MAGKLFVRGLPATATSQALTEYFSSYGEVVEADVTELPDSQKGSLGFVRFSDPESVTVVLAQGGHKVAGVDVELVRAKAPGAAGETTAAVEAILAAPGPCRHYMLGRCTYGDRCSFRHDPADLPVLTDPSVVPVGEMEVDSATPRGGQNRICRHFLTGRCNYGDQCSFQHPGQDAGGVAAAAANQAMNGFHFGAPAAPAPGSEKGICRHYLNGRCTYGDQCSFRHDGSALAPEAAAAHWQGGLQLAAAAATPALMAVGNYSAPTPCRHFLQGRCKYGDQCKFSHPGAEVAQATRPPCRHFLQGRCNYGDQCSFSHSGAPMMQLMQPVMPVVTLPQVANQSYSTPPPCRHFLQGRCNYGDQCSFSHPGAEFAQAVAKPFGKPVVQAPVLAALPAMAAPAVPKGERELCRHFLQGRCNYGDRCTFPHSLDAQVPAVETLGYNQVSAVENSATGSAVCRHHLAGRCNFGDSCRFAHPGPQAMQWPTAPQEGGGGGGATVCRHFLQGRCNYGSECRFSHDAAAGGKASLAIYAPAPTGKGGNRAQPY